MQTFIASSNRGNGIREKTTFYNRTRYDRSVFKKIPRETELSRTPTATVDGFCTKKRESICKQRKYYSIQREKEFNKNCEDDRQEKQNVHKKFQSIQVQIPLCVKQCKVKILAQKKKKTKKVILNVKNSCVRIILNVNK